MSKHTEIESVGLLAAHWSVCASRVRPILKHWGRFCDVFSMETLGVSCYTQGFTDAMQVAESKFGAVIPIEAEPIHYEI